MDRPHAERPTLRTKSDGRYGVVTLADHNYFPGLRLLCESIRESWPVDVICFDVGLTEDQRAFAALHYPELEVLPLPEMDRISRIKRAFEKATPLAKTTKRVWPLWLCPFLIAASDLQRVFWFDCDVVILRNLRTLFSMLDEGPVFTPENNAPNVTANKPELLCPVAH